MLFLEYGGKIIHIYFAVTCGLYCKSLKLFSEYSQSLRSQGGINNIICKLFINSFYGKLGSSLTFDKISLSTDPQEIDNKNEYLSYEGIYLYKNTSNKKNINVAIASAITSKARIKLYRAMMTTIFEGGRLLYVDTDSVVAAFKNYSSVLDRVLGNGVYFDSNLRDTILKNACFSGVKTYSLILSNGENITRILGVNSYVNFKKFQYFFCNNIVFYSSDKVVFRGGVHKKVFIYKKINLFSYSKRVFSFDKKYTSAQNIGTHN